MLARTGFLTTALVATCLITVSMFASQSVSARSDAGRPPYTDADWALLPEWCIDTMDGPYGSPRFGADTGPVGRNKSPRSDYWTGIFGSSFWALHHFCRALYAERHAIQTAKSNTERHSALHAAILDYLYVIKNSSEEMPLMPEVYFRAGALYLRIGDRERASESFAAARRIKPDYWPAYTRWAEELISLRLFDTARKLVDTGLLFAPDQPQLIAMKQRLAGARNGSVGASAPSTKRPPSGSSSR